jgi:hypothetical protein
MENQPAKGIYTSEFSLTIIKVIVGMLVMGGVIAPQHQTDVTTTVTTIVGGLIALVPAVTYLIGRTWLKAKVAQPGPTSTISVNPTTVVTP